MTRALWQAFIPLVAVKFNFLTYHHQERWYECNHCIILFVCVLDKDSLWVESSHAFDVSCMIWLITSQLKLYHLNIDKCRKAVRPPSLLSICNALVAFSRHCFGIGLSLSLLTRLLDFHQGRLMADTLTSNTPTANLGPNAFSGVRLWGYWSLVRFDTVPLRCLQDASLCWNFLTDLQ